MDLKALIKEAEKLEAIRLDVNKKIELLGGLEQAERALKQAHAEAERLVHNAATQADSLRADTKAERELAKKERIEQQRLVVEASELKDKYAAQLDALNAAQTRFEVVRAEALKSLDVAAQSLKDRELALLERSAKLVERIKRIEAALAV